MTGYDAFLEEKAQLASVGGFEPTVIPDHLFDFQVELLDWSVRHGRAGVFADCGLGKTPIELAWAQNVHEHTGKPVLLLTPLAVGFQIVAEGEKFGHEAVMSRTGQVSAPITVTNYEQLGKFDPDDYAGVVCDESSILKSFDGETRAAVTEFARRIPYRFLGTATAAPNDYIELGTSSEALGGLGYVDMLTRFFVNDNRTTTSRAKFAAGGRSVGWRLKGHAGGPFWRWVASWARAVRRPSDLGFDDGRFVLPELLERETIVEARTSRPDTLFDMPAIGLAEEREETRRTLTERCEAAAEQLGSEPGVAWCHLNDESALLAHLIPDAVEVTGADSPDAKEDKLAAFSRGEIPVLVTKPSIGAWGLNWQHVNRMTYFPTHSYEQYYQAVRRSWRFGQTRPVTVDLVTTEGGRTALENLRRKAAQADAMFSELVAHMNAAATVDRHRYDNEVEVPSFHGCIYSPPFLGLYQYSSDVRDLSNVRDPQEFRRGYGMFVEEIERLLMPGRTVAVHAAPVPSGNSGKDAMQDFPGDVIRIHQDHGFDWIERKVIWKEPLAVRNRTMQKNLAHKTLVDDGAYVGTAAADELLIFRKRGSNPVPVQHPTGLHDYAGSTPVPSELAQYRAWDGKQTENRYSHWIWRRYASSVWDDIRIDRVLPFRDARDEDDEKHVHPLQLDVIARYLQLRTLPGERVLTPFMGVGSEVFEAVRQGRVGVGVELKPSYYVQAVRNLENVDQELTDPEQIDFAALGDLA